VTAKVERIFFLCSHSIIISMYIYNIKIFKHTVYLIKSTTKEKGQDETN